MSFAVERGRTRRRWMRDSVASRSRRLATISQPFPFSAQTDIISMSSQGDVHSDGEGSAAPLRRSQRPRRSATQGASSPADAADAPRVRELVRDSRADPLRHLTSLSCSG